MNKNIDYPEAVMEKLSCSNCIFYAPIDSGYGWCTKNPPQITTWVRKFIFFFKYACYPEVPWHLKKCGCFIQKEKI